MKKNLPNNSDLFEQARPTPGAGRPAGATGDPRWCCLCVGRERRNRAAYRVGAKGFCFGHKAEANATAANRGVSREHGGKTWSE